MNYYQQPILVKRIITYAKKHNLLDKPTIIKRKLGLQASRQLICYWLRDEKNKKLGRR